MKHHNSALQGVIYLLLYGIPKQKGEEILEDFTQDRYKLLTQHFKKYTITKSELAKDILGVSLSTVNRYMAMGTGVPPWKKLGSQEHSKVLFDPLDVALFLDTEKNRVA